MKRLLTLTAALALAAGAAQAQSLSDPTTRGKSIDDPRQTWKETLCMLEAHRLKLDFDKPPINCGPDRPRAFSLGISQWPGGTGYKFKKLVSLTISCGVYQVASVGGVSSSMQSAIEAAQFWLEIEGK
jgi:hypothetical protein